MSPEPARANVRVMAAPADQPVGGSTDPDAQPPTPIGPPLTGEEPTQPDMGGPVLPHVQPDEFAQASGAGLAERLSARYRAISATEEFPVPGWELDDGSPGLIVLARTFGDRKAFNEGVSHEVFIARSTHKLLFVNDDGTREEIPGGWGPQLAQLIGVQAAKAADLVRLVISKPDPDNEETRIPNVAGIATLAQAMVIWAGRGQREAEDELGE